MWITNLFKKSGKAQSEQQRHISFEENLLNQTIDFIPSHFRNSQTYAHIVEYLSHNQLNQAVKALIQLGDQPNYFFNNDYWLELAHIATKLNMTEEYKLCQQKLESNKINNIVLYKGIVIEKVSEDTFKHYISDSLTNEHNEERRVRDGLKELMTENGFFMRGNGKEGIIYYIVNKRVCEIKYQQIHPGGPTTIYTYSYEYWALPIRQRLNEQEKETLSKALNEWLKHEQITPDFE